MAYTFLINYHCQHAGEIHNVTHAISENYSRNSVTISVFLGNFCLFFPLLQWCIFTLAETLKTLAAAHNTYLNIRFIPKSVNMTTL